ncbi:MAG: hypothetical protein NUW23_05440 [Firmicutes bacterium]|jgi:hypothetical protein|nr:hypothetical protein [Bacillota bacterium]
MRLCKLASLVLLAVVLAAPARVYATGATLDPSATSAQADEQLEHPILLQRVAEAFPDLGLTVEELTAFFDSGWGIGELVIAAVIASQTATPYADVLAVAADGTGWGELAMSLGLQERNLGQAISAVVSRRSLHGKARDEELAEAACSDLAAATCGLPTAVQARLREQFKVTHREMLVAAILVGASGDSDALRLALRLRSEQRSWNEIRAQTGKPDHPAGKPDHESDTGKAGDAGPKGSGRGQSDTGGGSGEPGPSGEGKDKVKGKPGK